MNQLLKFLSGRTVGIFFTLISVLVINTVQQLVENLGWDNSFSIAAAKNISDGHGYSITMSSPNDFSKVIYEPLNKWPPGYSLLLVFVHAFSHADWIYSVYILNAIGLTTLVLVFRKMLFQLELPVWIINSAVLVFGFIKHPYCEDKFTDLFGVIFFMAGCSFLLQYVKSGKRPLMLTILASLLFAFCCCIKYLYMGISLVPFACLFYYGLKTKTSSFRRWAVIGFSIICLSIGLLIFFQYNNSGQAVYLNPTKTGFFPGQLLSLGPIVLESFLPINFLNQEISRFTLIPYKTLKEISSVINALMLLWLGYLAWSLMRKKLLLQKNYYGFYAGLTFYVGAVIILALGFLTVTNYQTPRQWVYFQAVRYYAPFCFMFLQFLVFLFVNPAVLFGKRAASIFKMLIITACFVQIFHTTHIIINGLIIKKEYGTLRKTEIQDLQGLKLANFEISNNNKVVICSFSPEIGNIGSLSGASSTFDLTLLEKPIHTSSPIVLITVLNESKNKLFERFLIESDNHLESEINGIYYYTKNIPKSVLVKNQ